MRKTNLSILLILVSFLFGYSSNSVNSDVENEHKVALTNNWEIASSAVLRKQGGDEIASVNYSTKGWNKAVVPGTILGSLVADGAINDPYFGINMKKIDASQFEDSWWYRNTFVLTKKDLNKSLSLRFEGINYRANLWINGKLIADNKDFAGTYNMFSFNINKYAVEGDNVIAVEIFQHVDGEYSLGFVDWNPVAPDKYMGIYRNVYLEKTGGVKIRSPYVCSKVNKETKQSAELTIQAELENNISHTVTGNLKIDYGIGKIEKKITIGANKTISCKFTPNEYNQLKVNNIKLWWPNGMGEPNLYNVEMEFVVDNQTSDKVSDKYGIREVESYLNENGDRTFEINGEFVLISGGGWVDDLMLQDTKESLEAQIKYVKHMNLNTVRLEGFWGKDHTLYDLCDEHGILIMVGWSCHWEWEDHLHKPTHSKYGGPVNEEDVNLMASYWYNQMLWLRNHPSIFLWMLGSDKIPVPELEEKYIDLFNRYDKSRPYVASAGGVGSDQGVLSEDVIMSEISGHTGMKMLGPYAYTPPMYWYTNKNLGGAYGFNTETGTGANIPPLASLVKMIPKDKLWPMDKEYWEYHCGKNAFQTLDRYTTAINERYGEPKNIEEFAFKSQLMNFELMRPMFESFIAHKPTSTGLIQWMLNSAWPEMYWQLYDTYLQPNAAFYAVRKAGNNVHAIYRYGYNDIYLSSNRLNGKNNLRVMATIYNTNSEKVYSTQWQGNIDGNSSKHIIKLPNSVDYGNVWFIDLRVLDDMGVEIDNGFYWLSKKQDELDYEAAKHLSWPYYTPSKGYSDFSDLNKLRQTKLLYDYKYEQKNDRAFIDLTIKNPTENIAFFIFVDVVDAVNEKPILPIFLDDNYLTLLPGEERSIKGYFNDNRLNKPVVKIKGFNVESVILK